MATALRPRGFSVASSTGFRTAWRRNKFPCGKCWHRAIELARETTTRENRIQVSKSRRSGFEGSALQAHPFRQLLQNSVDFRKLIFAELNQTIIQIDGFERFNENCLSRCARAVDHSRERFVVLRRELELRSVRSEA